MQVQNNFDLPPELCTKPLALVGISGLDTVNNAIHKSIWDTFSGNRRVERASVAFKLIGNDYEFPAMKPKRNSYDWYIPKGILKKNWMVKHLYHIPAVIVIFYDLDWTDQAWSEKMIECSSRVRSMRAALDGRNTRIIVVLIQNSLPLPSSEDTLGTERAAALCTSCELQNNSLFVLPHGDHLQGYALRLETAFFEFAQNYYHNEIRNIKTHKEHLNKTNHLNLFVRHQFKLGFLYELKQDNQTSLKHYTHAYNNLLEIRIVDTNALEIRTVAGFINYKLCRLMFQLNLPRDAITQFKNHTDRFKARIGFQELAFEHYAWLSQQFSVFGISFEEAVKLGVTPVQTQHPGIYFQQAAHYAQLRKKACQELCSSVTAYPKPDPFDSNIYLEFYGHRPWRQEKLIADRPEPQLESNGIQALQYLEKNDVHHSNVIIHLFGLAISQYKTYRCPRTRRHLVLQMADEYYNSQDYGKALTLLTHMLSDFRAEKWWKLLSDILEKAIKCAYLTANISDYISLALEILGQHATVDFEEKKFIYSNLCRIVSKEIPLGNPKLPPEILPSAIIQWEKIFNAPQLNLNLDMQSIVTCIETKARFIRATYEVDRNVSVEIFIRNTSPFSLQFSKLSVTINTTSYTADYEVDTGREEKCFEFSDDQIKKFVIEFLPDPNDIHNEIQISSVNLSMGNRGSSSVDYKFSNFLQNNGICSELLHFKQCKVDHDFDNIKPLLKTLITPRNSRLDIKFEHAEPALVGEWYGIQIFIDNMERSPLKDFNIEITLTDEESVEFSEFSLKSNGKPQKLPLLLIENESFDRTKKNITAKFYLRPLKKGDRNIQVKISYILDSQKPIASVKLETFTVPVVEPFEIVTTFQSGLMNNIHRFYVGEEFQIVQVINFKSPWPIVIESTGLEANYPVSVIPTGTNCNQLNGVKFSNGETAVDMVLATCLKNSEQNVNVGIYNVKWRRENGQTTTSQLPVVGCSIEWIPLSLSMNSPSYGLLRTPLLVEYCFGNRSSQLIQLTVSMEASDAFMFAGYKQFSVSVLPHSVRTVKYNLYPLFTGNVLLPKLIPVVPENSTEGPALRQEQIQSLVERTLPTHVFVLPQKKGDSNVVDVLNRREVA